jgi:hypothetical protein
MTAFLKLELQLVAASIAVMPFENLSRHPDNACQDGNCSSAAEGNSSCQ